MGELFDIKGYEGLYSITIDGRIWSNFQGSNININGKWISPYTSNKGYSVVNLYKNGVMKHKLLHCILIETFIPNPDNKPFCNHKDGNKLNNSLDNLEWCTTRENTIHAYAHGLINLQTEKNIAVHKHWGIINQSATLKATRKFTIEQIAEIKEVYKRLKCYSEVGRLFFCCGKTIEKIVNNKSYKLAA